MLHIIEYMLYIVYYSGTRELGRARRGSARGGVLGRGVRGTPLCPWGGQEFAKGGLAKRGLAIYVFPLCNCNTLVSVVDVQIEHMPNC